MPLFMDLHQLTESVSLEEVPHTELADVAARGDNSETASMQHAEAIHACSAYRSGSSPPGHAGLVMAASPGRGSRILAGRRLSTGRAARRDRLNTVTLGAQSALGPGDRVQTGTRALLVAFAVFTLLAVSSLLVLGEQTDTFFAWTIRSGPNAAFLGAAYAAGLVLSVLAVRQRRWSRVRVH